MWSRSFRKILNKYRVVFLSILIFLCVSSSYGQTGTVKQWADAPAFLSWQGSLNENESDYFQGEVIPFVYSLAGLTVGTSYTFNIDYDYFHGSQNAGGYAYISPIKYNISRPGATAITASTTPQPDDNFANFYVVNANITNVTSPVDISTGTIIRRVSVTFTASATDVDIYWGMYLARRNTITDAGTPPTAGAGDWPGGSLQVTLSGITNTNTSINPGGGIVEGVISGMKYSDLNKDGSKQNNEPGLANWTIYIDLNSNATPDGNDITTLTDANGNYTFNDLFPGTYIVREVNQAGLCYT